MKRLAVLGAGSWGTALAIALSQRFDSVCVWTRDEARALEMQQCRENRRYLAGFRFPSNLTLSSRLSECLDESQILLSVVPSSHLRAVLETAASMITPASIVVSATKGIEEETLRRMSELIAEHGITRERIAVLSGPTFAKEVAASEPAAVVIASDQISTAEMIQRAFATPSLRLYTSADTVGVEIGAALKNVIAIGAGICRGLGLGSNSVAALVTRGLAEITRLALRMGGNPRTLSGLAGLGDLVLTATGDLSRNRYVGLQLGQGHKLAQVISSMTMVAEGVSTCRAAHRIGEREAVDLPIINEMYRVLYEAKDPRHAIRDLMERPLTNE